MLKKFRSSTQVCLALLLSLFSTNVLPAAVAYATPTPSGPGKQTICHRANSDTNPYQIIEVDKSSIDEPNNKFLNGHGDHTGPVWNPTLKDLKIKWGDIIPPFVNDAGTVYPGQNWTTEGQAFYNNDCAIPTPPADLCPNLPGVQATVPLGLIVDQQGNCVTPPVVIDLCPNLDGIQLVVPLGLIVNEQGNCVAPPIVIDVCPNIEGVQLVVPLGLIVNEQGNCVTPPVVIDLCPNLDGIQLVVPEGMKVDREGNCVDKKITICHRTNSVKNPYNMITVSINAVDGQGQNDHTHHEGPIFDPLTMENGDDWGDIIPPNQYDLDGYNWTTEGQALYGNDCNALKGATTGTPKFKDFCGEQFDVLRIPTNEGVIYSVNGEEVDGGWMSAPSGEVTVTAAAAEGYVLHEDAVTEWTFTYTDENCLTITKTAQPLTDTNKDGILGVGDSVVWTITVTNNGTKWFENFTVQVSDANATTLENDGFIESIAPGESVSLEATTLITAAHVGAVCKVENTAIFGATYSQIELERVVLQEEGLVLLDEEPVVYDFTGSASADMTFTCPTPGSGGGNVLTSATTTKLPATLPSTGGETGPLALVLAMIAAYGAVYFLQGRRQLNTAAQK